MNVRGLLDHLVTIEAGVPDLEARYLLRPRGGIETPCLYHVLPTTGTHERITTGTGKDTIYITTRIAVSHTEPEHEADQLLRLIDSYLDVVDPLLWERDALPAGMRDQRRTGFSQGLDEFNGVPYLCVDFQLAFELTRPIR